MGVPDRHLHRPAHGDDRREPGRPSTASPATTSDEYAATLPGPLGRRRRGRQASPTRSCPVDAQEPQGRDHRVRPSTSTPAPRPSRSSSPGSSPCSRRTGSSPPATLRGICDGAASPGRGRRRSGPRSAACSPSPAWWAGASAGCDPNVMGIGPVPSRQAAPWSRPDSSLDDIALVEVNEAFAPQYVAVEKRARTGPQHHQRQRRRHRSGPPPRRPPAPASRPRIIHELRRRGDKYGLGTACIGGGQGIAVIVEAL